jgi:quercetin dioxygenase-like cupin family protein
MSGVRDDLGRLLVRTTDEIAATPWEAIRPGVQQKVLWRSGDVVLGLMRIAPGAENPEHVHLGAHHHILMTSGSCDMVGRTLSAGAYVYIPPGTPHAVTAVGPDGCEFFYTYRPVEAAAAERPEDWGNPV